MGSVFSSLVNACESIVQLCTPSSTHPSSVSIKGGQYRINMLVGEGGYSFVYKATDKAGGGFVALKRFAIQDPEEQLRLLEEVRIHRALCPHENIVTLIEHDVLTVRGKPLPEIWIAMEFVGPSLQQLVNARMSAKKSVERSVLLGVFRDMVCALAHMHSQSPPIAHWDVKLDNILQGERYQLCDFGSASKVYYECKNAQDVAAAQEELALRMTLLYRAPESLDLWRKQRVDMKADVWSLGVALYTAIVQDMPFDENPLDILMGRPKLFRGKSDNAFTPGHAENILPEELQDVMHCVMSSMLVPDPTQRADIFLVGEYLSKIDATFQAPARPRPGFSSAQRDRFAK